LAWYRSGKDVQQFLPYLATYLGHANIASTQRYLRMTPELLQQASCRFAVYAQYVATQEDGHA
jgi:integrase/recombinase XerD